MNADTVITALFNPNTYALTVSVSGFGSVSRTPDQASYQFGTTVQLTATPGAGWRFAEWQGDLSGTSIAAQLPMATSREVVAVFQRLPEEKQWSVALNGGAHGTITPVGTQTVSDGTTVRVRIEPDAGYQVDRFLIDGIPLSLPTTAAQIYDVGPVTADSRVQCSFVAAPVVPKTRVVCFTIGSIWLTVDRQQIGMDAAAVIQNNRTLLPIRAIVEVFGGTIEWHAELQVVTLYLNGNQVSLQIGNQQGYVNGVQTAIDGSDPKVVPVIISDRTYLPLRFVAENLGLQVEWNPALQTATVRG
jgi:hypothetical protein